MNTTAIAEALREIASPWLDAEAAAAYLRFSVRHFRERVAVQPDFPKPRYFPALRWKRSELDAWADRQTVQRRGEP